MRTHRRNRSRRYAAAVLASIAAAVGGPAAALAEPGEDYPRPVAPTVSVTPSDFTAKIGDTPAEFGQPVAPAPKVGDTPADFPGASRAPQYDPPTSITVVRPERTIVRATNAALPLILASLALLVALAVAGMALVQMRSPRVGRVAH